MRSGRVQFAGVPVAREAAALLRLHQTLVKHFEHLELHDRVSILIIFPDVVRYRPVLQYQKTHVGVLAFSAEFPFFLPALLFQSKRL